MPASSLILTGLLDKKTCLLAKKDWFIGQKGALVVPSAKSIQRFDCQLTAPADSCQFDSRTYGDNFIDEISKESPRNSELEPIFK